MNILENRVEDAKLLLSESFQKQEAKTFDQNYILSFSVKMLDMLKSEYIDEVQGIMKQFESNYSK